MADFLGVVGLGNITKRHRRNLKTLFPEKKIVGVSASNRAKNEADNDIDEFLSLEGLIKLRPDFVMVASPATMHKEHALPILNSGIPVIIEKPLAADSISAEKISSAAQKSGTPAAVAYCLRFSQSAQFVKEFLASQDLGEIYNVIVEVGQYLPQWRPSIDYRDSVSAKKELGGGVLLELSHELDYLQWLLGDLECQSAISRKTKELELDVEEIVDAVLTTKKGAICYLHLDFIQKSPRRYCSVIGQNGRLDWDLISERVVLHDAKGSRELFKVRDNDPNSKYLLMLKNFEALVEGKTHNCVSIESALQTIRLVEQIKRANNG